MLDFIEDDSIMLERAPLEQLAQQGELMVHHHHGYWQCMDTLRDKMTLDELWHSGQAPWKG